MQHSLVPDAVLSENRYEFAARRLAALGDAMPGQTVFDIGAGRGRMRAVAESAGLHRRGFDLCPADDTVLCWDLNESCPVPNVKADCILDRFPT